MKIFISLLSCVCLLAPMKLIAGACETNAASITSALERKCSKKSAAECLTCVEKQYITLTKAVPEKCKTEEPKGAVLAAKEKFLSDNCK